MKNDYYQEIIQDIEEKMQSNPQEAKRLIENELSMPYIPMDIEHRLLECQRSLRALMNNNSFHINLECIEEYLLSDDQHKQLKAIETLNRCNAREYSEAIQKYFDSKPHLNLQALMIDTLISQQIRDEYQVSHQGQEIHFIPCYIERADETDGFVQAEILLNKWYGSDNPSFYKLCMQIVMQKTFLMLPLAYEDQEAQMLALSAVHEVSNSMDDGESFKILLNQLGLTDCVLLC